MGNHGSRVAIIGGGIAGLCAAVYARKSGYEVDVFEAHDSPGGLATSWRRGEYTFETCLHWLLGSHPQSPTHAKWQEVFDIGGLEFIHQDEFIRVEDETGACLKVYADIDRLETEMLKRAPQDERAIRSFATAVRRLGNFQLPDASEGLLKKLQIYLQDSVFLPLFHELSGLSAKEYAERFTDPLIRLFFGDGESSRMSVLAVLFSLAWVNRHDADYPIGGSQAVIRAISDELVSLGGQLHLGTRVDEILVREDVAVGLRLSDGTIVKADRVISAADGHATLFDLLHGRYVTEQVSKMYREFETFATYAQVSLGIAKDLSDQPAFLSKRVSTPVRVDPGTELSQLSFRFFHFDPTFSPKGKTAVTCLLPTRNFQYWVELEGNNRARYEEEKRQLAEQVVLLLESRIPGVRDAIEVTDVSTPATVIRCTGNWRGSMQGWFLSPGMGIQQLPKTLPGLDRFMMVGQWVEPGGGLPAGLFTSRAAVRDMCRMDGVPFIPSRTEALSRT